MQVNNALLFRTHRVYEDFKMREITDQNWVPNQITLKILKSGIKSVCQEFSSRIIRLPVCV